MVFALTRTAARWPLNIVSARAVRLPMVPMGIGPAALPLRSWRITPYSPHPFVASIRSPSRHLRIWEGVFPVSENARAPIIHVQRQQFRSAQVRNDGWLPWFAAALLAFSVGCFKKAMEGESRDDLGLKQRAEDTPRIRNLKEFVNRFREAVDKDERDKFRADALNRIDEIRFLGDLTARKFDFPDLDSARRELLILSNCNDHIVQTESFRCLKILLRHTSVIEPNARLLELAFVLSTQLKQSSEVNDSISYIVEQISCYRLVLERLVVNTMETGSYISADDRKSLASSASEISVKLANNPVFQYEAAYARDLALHLPAPSQPVTETIRALKVLFKAVKGVCNELEPLLATNFFASGDINDIADFISTEIETGKLTDASAKLAEESVEILVRLVGRNDNNFGHALVLATLGRQIRTEADLKSTQEFVDKVKLYANKDENWIYLYRMVEILEELVVSKADDLLRKKGLKVISEIIAKNIPWQVRYKIITVLDRLNHDLELTDEVETVRMKSDDIPCPDPKFHHSQERHKKMVRHLAETQGWLDKFYARRVLELDRSSKIFSKYCSFLGSGIMRPLISRDGDIASIAEQFRILPAGVLFINGGKGRGKSTLAMQYAVAHARDYSMVHWIDANQIDEDLDKIANSLGLGEVAREVKVKLLKKKMAENSGWLLIIDNLQEKHLNQIQELLPMAGGHVLITTFCHDALKARLPHPAIGLGVFSVEESVHFLTDGKALVDQKRERLTARMIAVEMGNHPLSLLSARLHMSHTGISFGDYLHTYKDHRIRLFPDGARDAEFESTRTTWDLNLESLQAINPLAYSMLRFVAYLDHNAIPLDVLQNWGIAFENKDAIAVQAAIGVLKANSLLEAKPEGSVYTILPVLQEVVKLRIPEHERSKEFLRVASTIKHCNPLVGVPDSLVPHYERIFENASEVGPLFTFDANHIVASSMGRLANYYESIHSERAMLVLELALRHMEPFSKFELPDYALLKMHYAKSLMIFGRINEARKCLAETSALLEGTLRGYPTYPRFLDINLMHLLALLSFHMWKKDRNLAHLEEARKGSESVYDACYEKFDLESELRVSLELLGDVAMEQGDYAKAVTYLSKYKKKGVIQPSDVLMHKKLSIALYRSRQDPALAIRYMADALKLLRKIYGDEHPEVKDSARLLREMEAGK